MSSHESKYPKIIYNENKQAINPNMGYPLTVEEYNDLLHHTHDVSTLVSSGGSDLSPDVNTNIAIINNNVTNLTAVVEELEEKIQEQSEAIITLQEYINTLNEYIENDIQIYVNDP